jgi:F-type H+-transporting ATPase subunit b
MSLARWTVCVALGVAAVGPWALPAKAQEGVIQDLEKAFEHAEAEVHEAATTDPSHGGGSTDPLEVSPDLAIFTFVVFVIVLIVLRKFAWGPIMEALERREHNVAEHIAQAERNHEQARALLAEYEQRLSGAANEVRELLEEARRDAESTKQSILAEARQGAEAEKARAVRDIESATDAALETIAKRSTDLAVDLAGKIVGAKLTKDEHARLIQDAVAKFPASSASSN